MVQNACIEEKAEAKRIEYIYELYGQNLTDHVIERLSTEYYSSIRLEMLRNAYAEKSAEVLK